MSEGVGIELLEGESLEDAVKRIAGTMEPSKTESPKKKSGSKSPSKPKKSRSTDQDPTPPVGDIPVYAAFHMYLLEGRTVEKLRSDARRERQQYGPGVQVFIHAHKPGEGCGEKCAELIPDA